MKCPAPPEDFPTTHRLVKVDARDFSSIANESIHLVVASPPFCGTGTTMVAALKNHRNSIGVELGTEHCRMAASRLMNENTPPFTQADLQIQLRAPAMAVS